MTDGSPPDSQRTSDAGVTFPWREKLTATALHFALSAAAAGVLLLFVMGAWYPHFFFATDGGWQGLRIVLVVNLVLGPALTFVVFRRGKRGLGLDLSVIATLQLVALLAGARILEQERPIALVFSQERFFSLSAGDYLDAGRDVPDLSTIPGPTPKRVAVQLPDDPVVQSDLRRRLMREEIPVYTHSPLFVPLERHLDAVRGAGVRRAWVDRFGARQLEAFLAEHGGTFEDWAFVPYSARYRVIYLVVRRSDGALVDMLDARAPG
jgi:hypothetical protein